MKTVVYKDGTYKEVERSDEFENDPDWLVTIAAQSQLSAHEKRIAELEAERDRYKAALERIVEPSPLSVRSQIVRAHRSIAQHALTTQEADK